MLWLLSIINRAGDEGLKTKKTPTSDKGLLLGYYTKLTNLTAFIYVCDHKFINNVLNVEAVLAAFNRDKALVGALSVLRTFYGPPSPDNQSSARN